MYLCWQTLWMLFCSWGADWDTWQSKIEDILDNSPPIVSRGRAMNPEEVRLDRFWRGYYQALKQFNDDMSQLDWVMFYKTHGVQRTDSDRLIMFEPVVVTPRLEQGVRPMPSRFACSPVQKAPLATNDNYPSLSRERKPLPDSCDPREIVDKQLRLHKQLLQKECAQAEGTDNGQVVDLLRKALQRLAVAQEKQNAAHGQKKETAIDAKLKRSVTVNLRDVSLVKAAAVLEYLADVKIVVENGQTSEGYYLRLENLSLQTALDRLLRGSNLTWEVCDDGLKITTREQSAVNNFWRGYYAALDRFNANLSKLDWVAYYKNHGEEIKQPRDPFDTEEETSTRKNMRFKPVAVVPRIECGVGSPYQPAKKMQTSTMSQSSTPPIFCQPGQSRNIVYPFEKQDSFRPIEQSIRSWKEGEVPGNCRPGHAPTVQPLTYADGLSKNCYPPGPGGSNFQPLPPSQICPSPPTWNTASPPPPPPPPPALPGWQMTPIQGVWATNRPKDGSLSFGPIAVPVSQSPQFQPVGQPQYRPIPASMQAVPAELPATKLTLEQIGRMAQLKIGDEIIIRQIHAIDASFTLSAEQIIWLKQQGVSDAVILVLQARTPRGASAAQQGVSPSNYLPVPLGPPVENPPPAPESRTKPAKEAAPPLGAVQTSFSQRESWPGLRYSEGPVNPQRPFTTEAPKKADPGDTARKVSQMVKEAAELDKAGRPTEARKLYLSAKEALAIGQVIAQKHRDDFEANLRQRIAVDFKDATLGQVISCLRGLTGLNIVPDLAAMREDGISLDQKLSLNVEDIALKSVLRLLLDQLHLTYVIKDEAIVITTVCVGQGKITQKVYPVADLTVPTQDQESSWDLHRALVRASQTKPCSLSGPCTGTAAAEPKRLDPKASAAANASEKQVQKATELVTLITDSIARDSWTNAGGRGTIHFAPTGQALVINQTPETHEAIARLLACLRDANDVAVALYVCVLSVPDGFLERALGPSKEKLPTLNEIQLQMLLEEARSDKRVDFLEEAKLTVVANHKATIDKCNYEFFTTTVTPVPCGKAVFFVPENVSFPIGNMMQFRPVISADRKSVRLSVSSQFTRMASGDVPSVPLEIRSPAVGDAEGDSIKTIMIQQPKIDVGSFDVTVNVADGSTVLLPTGVKVPKESINEDASSPFCDMPLIGDLFRTTTATREPRNVIILVTPRIIVGDKTSADAAEKKPPVPDDMLSRAQQLQARGRTIMVPTTPPAAETRPMGSDLPADAGTDHPTDGVAKVAACWLKNVQMTTGVDGKSFPGLAGRVYLFSSDPPDGAPVQAKGRAKVIVDMTYTAKKRQQRVRWVFDKEYLPQLLRRDVLGWGYTLPLPWLEYQPDVTDVKIQVAYVPESGPTVTSPSHTFDPIAPQSNLADQQAKAAVENVPVQPAASPRMTQVRFGKPSGMKIRWYTKVDGKEQYSRCPLETPAEYNFVQGGVYRLKLTNIQDRPELELHPTMEVMPENARSRDFLAHSMVPVSFSADDFDQVRRNNYLVKVVYLPDPAYQDQFDISPVAEIDSARLDPGTDPIIEARKRGSVLLVIRLGNLQQELQHCPPVHAGPKPAPPDIEDPNSPGFWQTIFDVLRGMVSQFADSWLSWSEVECLQRNCLMPADRQISNSVATPVPPKDSGRVLPHLRERSR